MVAVTSNEGETLRLPLSGLIFQVRSDGRWRHLTQIQYDDEQDGSFRPGPDAWDTPDEPGEDVGGRAQWGPGQYDDEETWWLVYGDSRTGPVEVRLADGRTPPIIRFGHIWICEWISRTQPAFISRGDESFMFFDRVPGYLMDNFDVDDQ
jgi:hypothetical protein